MKNIKFDHTARPPIIHLSLSTRPPGFPQDPPSPFSKSDLKPGPSSFSHAGAISGPGEKCEHARHFFPLIDLVSRMLLKFVVISGICYH
jgi:hypothetical protein